MVVARGGRDDRQRSDSVRKEAVVQHVAHRYHLATRTRVSTLTLVALVALAVALLLLAIDGTGTARVATLRPDGSTVARSRLGAFGPLEPLSAAQRLELTPVRIPGGR
jgi:hypothetical protein